MELLDLNGEMVFFKYRFSSIFGKLIILLEKAVTEKNKNYERITHKILNIAAKLSDQHIKLFLSPPQQIGSDLISRYPNTTPADIDKLHAIIAKLHKIYQIQYFSNSNPPS